MYTLNAQCLFDTEIHYEDASNTRSVFEVLYEILIKYFVYN